MGFLDGVTKAWDQFTGKAQEGDLKQGQVRADQNYSKQSDLINNAGSAAVGDLAGYAKGGAAGFDKYAKSTGAYGSGGANEVYGDWLKNNPAQAYLDYQQKQGRQIANRDGGYGSGADRLAAQKAAMLGFGGYQAQLNQLGQEGQAAAGQTAQLRQQTAGLGANALAGNTADYMKTQHDLALNESTGWTNATNAIGAVGSFFGGKYGGQAPGVAGGNNLGYQPGTAANGGWSTTTQQAPQAPWYSKMFS